MGNIERENSLGRPESTTPWWLRYEGEQPLMDDLPTSSAATELERLRRQLQGAVEQQPQRQDSLADQLRDVHRAALWMGCFDAADWLQRTAAIGGGSDATP